MQTAVAGSNYDFRLRRVFNHSSSQGIASSPMCLLTSFKPVIQIERGGTAGVATHHLWRCSLSGRVVLRKPAKSSGLSLNFRVAWSKCQLVAGCGSSIDAFSPVQIRNVKNTANS